MRKAIIFLFLILSTAPAFAGQYPVVKVVDGDTIDVIFEGKKERVRLLCVNTPESVHPDRSRNTEIGRKASKYAKSRLAGKDVGLEFEGRKRGNYGRLLAYVILDGQNFNVELVREGWSPYYVKYGESENHHAEFLAAEKEAKAKGLNIWAAGSEEPSQPVLGTTYHGNIKSRTFHAPGCRYYNCKNCIKEFESREAAVRAGYRPCGICKP